MNNYYKEMLRLKDIGKEEIVEENYLRKEKEGNLEKEDIEKYNDLIEKLDHSKITPQRFYNDRIPYYYKLKEYDKAIEDIKVLIYLENKNNKHIHRKSDIEPLTHLCIGKTYYFRDDIMKAYKHFDEARGYNIEDEVCYCLGVINYRLKDYGSAIIHFKRSFNTNRNFIESCNMLALCYKKLYSELKEKIKSKK